jgi:hypothetical protein
LKHAIEVADVDAELERGRAHDAGRDAMIEALLGQRPLLLRDRAVVDEHLGARAAHVLGDDLGDRPRLTEEQALARLGHLRGRLGQGRQRVVADDQQLALGRRVRGIDDRALALGAALQPHRDLLGVADGRAQADALDVVARERGEPLDHADQVGAAVGAGHGVDLVDDDDPQIGEQPGRVDRLRHQHDLERLGRGHQQLGRLAQEGATLVAGGVPVPDEAAEPDHLRVAVEALGLVVEQRLDRGDVERADALRLIADQRREHREHAGLGLAAGGRREDHGVVAREQHLAGQLLHRAQAGPAEAGDDRLLQAGMQPREHAHGGHHTSSTGIGPDSSPSTSLITAPSFCSALSSSGVSLRGS